MIFAFQRQEPIFDRIYFAIVLDQKTMKERILIGTDIEIRLALKGSKQPLIYDQKRPLGTFMIQLPSDIERKWNIIIMRLRDALQSNRWKRPALEQEACAFLSEQYDSGNPAQMYCAVRIWNDYLIAKLPRDRKIAVEHYHHTVTALPFVFHFEEKHSPFEEAKRTERIDPHHKIAMAATPYGTKLELRYASAKGGMECAMVYESFSAFMAYYFHRLHEFGLQYVQCQYCGNYFLARSRHHGLCSETCQKEQQTINKKEHMERIEGIPYEQQYRNAYTYWQNRVRKLKNKQASPETMAQFKETLSIIRKEALAMKKQVAAKQLPEQVFFDFLFAKSSEVDELTETYLQTINPS